MVRYLLIFCRARNEWLLLVIRRVAWRGPWRSSWRSVTRFVTFCGAVRDVNARLKMRFDLCWRLTQIGSRFRDVVFFVFKISTMFFVKEARDYRIGFACFFSGKYLTNSNRHWGTIAFNDFFLFDLILGSMDRIVIGLRVSLLGDCGFRSLASGWKSMQSSGTNDECVRHRCGRFAFVVY